MSADQSRPSFRDPSFSDVDEVVALLARWGAQHYDDRVSQLDHALQCASLAEQAGAPGELIAAALLHDIGHLIELDRSTGQIGDLSVDRHHETIAGRALAGLFPDEVTGPIALHVEAKRYLCAVDPGYHATLSDGSVRSLVTQGGPMTDEEMAQFERHASYREAADLRRWDDAGKVTGLQVATLDHFVTLLRRVAQSKS